MKILHDSDAVHDVIEHLLGWKISIERRFIAVAYAMNRQR